MATMPPTVTNYASNPRPLTGLDTGGGGWTYLAGVGEAGASMVATSEGPLGALGFARRTVTTEKTSGPNGWVYSEASSGGVGSERVVALYVRSSVAVDVSVRVDFLLGGVVAGSTTVNAITCPPDTWIQVTGEGGSTGPFDEMRATASTEDPFPAAATFDASSIFLDYGDADPVTEAYPSPFLYPSYTIFPEA